MGNKQLAGKDKRRNTWALYTRKVNKTQVTAIQMGRAISAEREEQRQEVRSGGRWKQLKWLHEHRNKEKERREGEEREGRKETERGVLKEGEWRLFKIKG